MAKKEGVISSLNWYLNNLTTTPPEHHLYPIYQRAVEATHVLLRQPVEDRGCVPCSITFTHGSASLVKANIPLTTAKTTRLESAAERIARIAHQRIFPLWDQNLSTDDYLKNYLNRQDALWVLTCGPETAHLFGCLKSDLKNWSVYDTAAGNLSAPYDYPLTTGCDLEAILARAGLHHTESRFPFVIFCFRNCQETVE